MRRRNRRKWTPQSESLYAAMITSDEAGASRPVPWNVEQLTAMGPVTGPGHRSFVPIVRTTVQDTPVRDVANPQA